MRPARGEATRVDDVLGGGALQIRWTDDFDREDVAVGEEHARLAHYKGFANGLDFADPCTAACLQKAVGLLDELDVVVWDGDGYAGNSFSHLLTLIAPAVKLVAVRTAAIAIACRRMLNPC